MKTYLLSNRRSALYIFKLNDQFVQLHYFFTGKPELYNPAGYHLVIACHCSAVIVDGIIFKFFNER